MSTIIRVLRESIRAVPAVRYALGVSGLIAAVALIQSFNVGWAVAVFGGIIMLGMMTLLVIFARLSAYGPKFFYWPAIFLTWAFVLLTVGSATLLASSVFFDTPIALRQSLAPGKASTSAAGEPESEVPTDSAGEPRNGAGEEEETYQSRVVLANDLINVAVQDRGDRVLLTLVTYPEIFPEIEVDYDQDGVRDPELDRMYAVLGSGEECTVFLLDGQRTTRCGEFASDAVVATHMIHAGSGEKKRIRWQIPKRELSSTGRSAHLLFRLYDQRGEPRRWAFPSETFRLSLKVRFP
jgi:hypothetical protein